MQTPLVTVVIPTHNRPELVGTALRSVLEQTFQGFEIVIVDDGLKKRAREAVEKVAETRICYIMHEKERGCSAAKNTGIKNAQGKYIAFLDDDDTWLPEKLERQVSALTTAPENVAFSFTGALEVFDDGEKIKKVPEGIADYHELALRNFNAMIASSLMIRRDVFDNVGLLDETFPTHTDIELMLRITKKYRGVGINEPLVRRLIISSHEQMGSNIQNRIRGREMLLAKYQGEFEKHPAFFAKHLALLGKFYRAVNDYRGARRAFKRALGMQRRLDHMLNYCSMLAGGLPYRLYKKLT